MDLTCIPNAEMIRVTLPEAVAFVVDLERRDDTARSRSMDSVSSPRVFDTAIRPLCKECGCEQGDDVQTWVLKHMATAERRGTACCPHVEQASREVQAQARNEFHHDHTPEPFYPGLVDYEG